jgi:hypothetical protein
VPAPSVANGLDVGAVVHQPTAETSVIRPRVSTESAPAFVVDTAPVSAGVAAAVSSPTRETQVLVRRPVSDSPPEDDPVPVPSPVPNPVADLVPDPVADPVPDLAPAAAPSLVLDLVLPPVRGPVQAPVVVPEPSDADTADYAVADLVRAEPADAEPAVVREPDGAPPAPGDAAGQPWIDEVAAWPRSLRGQFGRYAEPVSRIVAASPHLRDEHEDPQEVLAQAVAVQLYLTESGRKADEALRESHEGFRAFGRHVLTGLRRLPLHRGSVMVSAAPTEQQWSRLGERGVLHQPLFTHALVTPDADPHGDTDVLIWSNGARRTTLLEPDDETPVDRVVFLPGARFEVLDAVRPGTDGDRGTVLLRELAEDEQDDDRAQRAAFNDLVTSIMRRWAAQWPAGAARPRLPADVVDRCHGVPGVG